MNCIHHAIYVDFYARNIVAHILHDFVPDLNCNSRTHTHTFTKRTARAVVCVCTCMRMFYLKLAIFVYNTHAMYIFFTEVMINLCTLSLDIFFSSRDFSFCQNVFHSQHIHYTSREQFSVVLFWLNTYTNAHIHKYRYWCSYSLTLNKKMNSEKHNDHELMNCLVIGLFFYTIMVSVVAVVLIFGLLLTCCCCLVACLLTSFHPMVYTYCLRNQFVVHEI